MPWYRADIIGVGFMIFEGKKVFVSKELVYLYPAENESAALEKAKRRVIEPDIESDLWFTDKNPSIEITPLSEPPDKEEVYLVYT